MDQESAPSGNTNTQERQPGTEAVMFDAGAFTIPHASYKGFEIKFGQSLRRRGEDQPLPLTDDEKETLRDHLKGDSEKGIPSEIEFMKGQARKIADREGREPTTKDYTDQFAPNVGIRNITTEVIEGRDILSIDTKPVTFKVYSELSTRESRDRLDLMDFAEATGTAAAVFTRDGKLILQYRGKGNRSYPNIPGASAAGMLKGQFRRDQEQKDGILRNVNRGRLDHIDPEVNLDKEISEELQIDPRTVDKKLIGIAHDEIKPHHELMYVASLNVDSKELAEKGLIPDDQEGHDFKERYFTIDGNPEAIEILLTRVKCPLPTTHSAVFFMAGCMRVAQRDGEQAAREWGKRVSHGIKANYEEIDRYVIENYDRFPNQLPGKASRSRNGYDPLYLPEQQGLPSLLDELVRERLISEEMYWKLNSKYNPQD